MRSVPGRRSAFSPSGTRLVSGIQRISVLSFGMCSTHVFSRARACACFRCRTGPKPTYGTTSAGKRFRLFALYFATERMVVERGPNLIPADDAGNLKEGEVPKTMCVRFRTLGCAPCTGAVASEATTLDEIATEAAAATRSERETRVIDHGANTMEDKKKEGYF